jgi:aspartyl-tRNA(Asn)/glutamyl-tRNA(Gln) amidotransferase subunit A
MNATNHRQLGELATALRNGQLSAVQASSRCLDRIALHDGAFRSFIAVEGEAAMRRAEQLDAIALSGQPMGPLHGVPLAVKDLFQRAGKPTTAGSTAYPQPAGSDAAVITRLHQAGAVVLGTLNLDEFAAGGTGMNAHFGRCCNPWDLERITGGSSSGSAAAVAAGLVPATLGSDTGGSARVPAAYCGVTAIKPSYGLVSLEGVFPRAPPFDSISPMGRSVEDCQTLLSIIAGGPTGSAGGLPEPDHALAQSAMLRIGIALEQFSDVAKPAVMGCLEDAVGILGRAASGLRRVHLPDLDLMTGLHQTVVKFEGAGIHREVLRTRPGSLSLAARSAIETGLFLDPSLASRALAVRAAVLEYFMGEVFADADVLLLPVTMSTAPSAQDVSQSSATDIVAFFAESGRACRFVNYLGLPALSLPCGFVDGLPVGLQLVGRPNQEADLFALGRAYQQMTDFHLRRPAAWG